jgi:DNA-binding XRE family transcriptional regulator
MRIERFGDLLKRYRVAAGLSQEALAERARMSAHSISSIERGARRLRISTPSRSWWRHSSSTHRARVARGGCRAGPEKSDPSGIRTPVRRAREQPCRAAHFIRGARARRSTNSGSTRSEPAGHPNRCGRDREDARCARGIFPDRRHGDRRSMVRRPGSRVGRLAPPREGKGVDDFPTPAADENHDIFGRLGST